jgi:protease-4
MRRLLLLTGLVSTSALAQVDATVHADLSRGATLLPESTAYAEGAIAPIYNPAGITHTGLGELFYAHERSIARGQTIDGLYGATNPIDPIALALSVEWLRGMGLDHRKTAFTFGVGGEGLSAGITFNWFNQGPVDGMTSVDLGLQSRFSRWFSFGAAIKNVDGPTRAGLTLARRFDFGIGVRPGLKERLTLGVDYIFDEAAGAANGRMAYSLNATVFSGVRLYAGASHGFQPNSGLYLQFGVELDTSHFGVGYVGGGASQGLNHLAFARLTADKMPSLPIAADVIALVDMAGLGSDGGGGTGGTVASLLGVKEADRYVRLITTLDRAANDPHLKGILLKVESSGLGLARAQELRNLIRTLQAKGKKVVALILSCGDAEYLVASAADYVFAVPEAMLQIDGLDSSVTFLGDTAQKIGVHFDVARVGAYKNSPDQFTRNDMSDEQREAINAYLDVDVKVLEGEIAESRKLKPEQVRAAIDEGLKPTHRAKELKLIDEVVTPAELDDQLAALIPGARLVRYTPFDEHTGRWGFPAKIAVIPVIGNIGGGNDQSDPLGLGLLGQAGADTFIRAIDSAAADSDVKAIVVRIDSPGGDGLAADLMYRAVLQARKRKPVIASMGDVAASGGYYVAMGAEEIWASPTTITGSIGVFYLKPSVKDLAEKLGVNHVRINRGALVGSSDYFEPWNDAQRVAAQKWIDAFYDGFITEVSLSRHKDKAEVDKVARGRVWSGEDAKARGLVDQLGGLVDALRTAKARVGYGEKDDIEYLVYGASGGILSSLISSSAVGRTVAKIPVDDAPPPPAPGLVQLAKELGLSAWQLEAGLKAHLGFELKVQ